VDVTDKLEQLKLSYLRSLTAKSAEINGHWQRVLDTDFGTGALHDLKTIVHRISGSAGMYGLGDVSASAQRIDEQLTDAHGADHAWRDNLQRSVEDLLKLMGRSRD